MNQSAEKKTTQLFAEKTVQGCTPFAAWVKRETYGLATVTCDVCMRQWRMVDTDVAFAIINPAEERCDACETCYDSHCMYCSSAVTDFNGIVISFRKFSTVMDE